MTDMHAKKSALKCLILKKNLVAVDLLHRNALFLHTSFNFSVQLKIKKTILMQKFELKLIW